MTSYGFLTDPSKISETPSVSSSANSRANCVLQSRVLQADHVDKHSGSAAAACLPLISGTLEQTSFSPLPLTLRTALLCASLVELPRSTEFAHL